MTVTQRGMVAIASLAYVASVGSLLVTRALGLRNEVQLVVAAIALTSVLAAPSIIARKWWGAKRTGKRAVANFAVLLTACVLSSVVTQQAQGDYPLYVVGLVLPVFLAAELAIDWRTVGKADLEGRG